MGKSHLFFTFILFLVFTSGCIGSPKAELSASDTDVSINTISNEHRTLNISVQVYNTGELDAENVLVTAEAQPIDETGGVILIGSSVISKISSKSKAVAFITWDTKKTYKNNMLKITIDPTNSIEEYDKANNVVLLSYSIN